MPDGPRPSLDTLRAGHEISSVSPRGIFIFALCFIATAVVMYVCLWLYMGFEVHRESLHEPGPFALGNNQPTTLPQPLQPSPAHNTLPWEDLPVLQDHQFQQLRSAGPLPGDPNHVHIPIDHAMQLFLQRGGLNTKPTTAPAETQPWRIPDSDRPRTVENRT